MHPCRWPRARQYYEQHLVAKVVTAESIAGNDPGSRHDQDDGDGHGSSREDKAERPARHRSPSLRGRYAGLHPAPRAAQPPAHLQESRLLRSIGCEQKQIAESSENLNRSHAGAAQPCGVFTARADCLLGATGLNARHSHTWAIQSPFYLEGQCALTPQCTIVWDGSNQDDRLVQAHDVPAAGQVRA